MSRWFRCYDDMLDDPKVQRLPPHLFKTLLNLWCLASKNEGVLPPIEDVAFRLRISDHDAKQQIDELIMAGLIDIGPDGKLRPHNWHLRQYDSDTSKERTRKWRERNKKKACDVTGDGGDGNGDGIDSDPETDTEIEKTPVASARPREAGSLVKDLVKGVLGRGGVVSARARRRVCAKLAIESADPLVEVYDNWPESQRARDPDALFIASAETLWSNTTEAVRSACRPLDARPPPEPIAAHAVRPSASLLASLNRGQRHGLPTH